MIKNPTYNKKFNEKIVHCEDCQHAVPFGSIGADGKHILSKCKYTDSENFSTFMDKDYVCDKFQKLKQKN